MMSQPGLRAATPTPSASEVGWFVGVDGQPIGPVGPAYIQRQINLGKVSASTLVWREGVADWRALNTFAELRPLLSRREAPSSPESAISAPVALTRKIHDEAGRSSAALVTALMSDEKQAEALSKSALDALDHEASEATVEPTPVPRAPEVASSPASESAPTVEPATPAPAAVSEAPPDKPHEAEDEFAFPPPPRAPSSVPPSSTELVPLGVPRRSKRAVHPMAWAFVAMAATFGAVSAWFLFGQTEAPVATNQAPTAVGASEGAPTPEPGAPSPDGDEAAGEEPGEAPSDDDTAPVGQPGSRTPAPKSGSTGNGEKTASAAPKTKKPCSPDDPFCSSVEGPAQKGPGSGDTSKSGQGLSAEQLQATVGRYRGSLTRTCRPLVTSGSAKVSATVSVGSSGAVQSVATSGGSEVPGLASCVQARIRNWRFPSSDGTSTFNVSFNFL